jgi:hypothetical protein
MPQKRVLEGLFFLTVLLIALAVLVIFSPLLAP